MVQCGRGSGGRASLRSAGMPNFPRHVAEHRGLSKGLLRKPPHHEIKGAELLGMCLWVLRASRPSEFAPREGWKSLHFSARSFRHGDQTGCRSLARYRSCGDLAGGLSRGLGLWRHLTNLRRARLRRHDRFPEERCAGLFERIFLHWAGLAHLGLLISSSFILLPAPILAVHPFEIRGRRGPAIRPLEQIVSYCVHRLSITVGRRDRSDLLSETAPEKAPYF
jgi:hypothetical protein